MGKIKDYIEIADSIRQYSPGALIAAAQKLDRKFVVHTGPTNSGKTYQSLIRLKESGNGVYLAPLRLLAAEIADRFNAEGVPCNLLTGDDSFFVKGARITSSTIELCRFNERYNTAVIDEAQLISDPDRGPAWFNAICRVNAAEVHICVAPEAVELIEKKLLKPFKSPYTIITHQRLCPLEYEGQLKRWGNLEPGDAVIAFSRSKVIEAAKEISGMGLKTSVIYGSLPVSARKKAAEDFAKGRTSVCVATDVIGIGLSLPIKRVVFTQTSKFDGRTMRPLTNAEILQIAGRAGRYGMFDTGCVAALCDPLPVKKALRQGAEKAKAIYYPCPVRDIIEEESPETIYRIWRLIPRQRGFYKEDVSDRLELLRMLRRNKVRMEKGSDMLRLISCSVDLRDEDLLRYWLKCAESICAGKELPEPETRERDPLRREETLYRMRLVRKQLRRAAERKMRS